MNEPPTSVSNVARELGYMTEAELIAITGWSQSTTTAKRYRREGPPFVRMGNAYYYPKEGVAAFMASRVKQPREVRAEALL
jgi:hypothetical protein